MEPFKDNFSPALVRCLAGHFETECKQFDKQAFEGAVLSELESLELKQRAQLISDQLHIALPTEARERRRILRAVLHPLNDDGDQQSDAKGVRGWGMMPLTMLVGQHGLDDFEASMLLLKEMTPRFTSEFDVRYFLIADQTRALALMKAWIKDPDAHVRRLVSEGTRPRLPWGKQLPGIIKNPGATLPLLEALRDDPSEYVRRSVANHLNDIAKDHPDRVAALAKAWLKDASSEREKLVRHACRSLIKQGHRGALSAFGLEPPEIELLQLNISTSEIQLGERLDFSAGVRSTAQRGQTLVIDYVLHFLKANGNQSPKVFKWKKVTLQAGESMELQKSHALRAVTTRRYYAGQQTLSLRINGEDFGAENFGLKL